MTTEELYYINSVSRGIDDIESLLDNPAKLRMVKSTGRSEIYYEVKGYFSISNDVSNRISKVLENAQEEIQSILEQKLATLKVEFERIVVQTSNSSDNETN